MDSIYGIYTDARKKDLASYIEENVINGEVPDEKGNTYVFLATNGSWQTRYLSLYEMLHDKYIARYCAKLLLDDYLDKFYSLITSLKSSGLSTKAIHEQLFKEIAFTKIVTVTVSSQLIGVALRNLIRDDDQYYFLRNPQEDNRLKSSPLLLRLASYYSFEEEKQFREISTPDKVILVNDVISSGKLVYSLSEKILKKGANINAVFCIADTRVPKSRLLKAEQLRGGYSEAEYIYDFLDNEGKIFSLVQCYGNENEIRKYKRPYTGDAKIKRVNPLLNTVVELETKHSEEKRILFPDPESFLKADFIKEAHFKIGHFRQNLSHNGYLTDMHNLFSTEGDNSKGKKVLYAIKDRINKFFEDQPPAIDVLDSMQKNLEWLKTSTEKMPDSAKLAEAILEFSNAYKKTKQDENSSYSPDYIFYPPFSGIEQLDEQLMHECFGTPIENIICLQRFDTGKGWRFPFPAKWYNHLTQDKSVLILDSGSLTGESMVQLVDSISFLDVREITVLCAITRIEDFYREFYSRIKSIKVKTLRDGSNKTAAGRQHIVPLQILFGINLNIPVYPSRVSCPFCEEIKTLEHYQDREQRFYPSQWAKQYLTDRLKELRHINLEKLEKYEAPSYLPKLKETNDINAIDIFLMRDRIGKVDSYRFYKDYFYYFDALKADIDSSGIYEKPNIYRLELVLLIILHEPHLVRTLADLLGDIYDFCQKLIEDLVFATNPLVHFEKLQYQWSRYSLIRLSVIFMPGRLRKTRYWKVLFEFALKDDKALYFLAFLLWEGFLGESNLVSNQQYIDIISYYSDKLDDQADGVLYKDKRFRKIVKSIADKYAFSTIETIHDAYFNLRKFFFSQQSSNTHNDLVRAILKFKRKIENLEKTQEDIPVIFDKIEQITNFLREGIMDNLLRIHNDSLLKEFHELEYQKIFNGKGIFEELKLLMQRFDIMIENKFEIQSTEDFDQLAKAYSDLDEFYLKYLIENCWFYNYCRGYKADLIHSIIEVISTTDKQLREKLNGEKRLILCDVEIDLKAGNHWKAPLQKRLAQLTDDEKLLLTIHQSFLERGIEEILINAIKYSSQNEVQIFISVENSDTETIVKFIQADSGDIPVQPEAITAIFGAFCGKENVRFYNNRSGHFTIELKFNQQTLK